MKKNYLTVLSILFAAVFAVSTSHVYAMDAKEKAAVQAAMHNFIKGKLSAQGGVYDLKGTKSKFDYLHDGVKAKGDLFVSCADFKLGKNVYDVDYYVKNVNGQYLVVKEIFHKENGKTIDEVLWQE